MNVHHIIFNNWMSDLSHIVDIVLIHRYKDDEGLIQHELTHVKQNLRTFHGHLKMEEMLRLIENAKHTQFNYIMYPLINIKL